MQTNGRRMNLSDWMCLILALRTPSTKKELAGDIDWSYPTVTRKVNELKDLGVVEPNGVTRIGRKNRPVTIWGLTYQGRRLATVFHKLYRDTMQETDTGNAKRTG